MKCLTLFSGNSKKINTCIMLFAADVTGIASVNK